MESLRRPASRANRLPPNGRTWLVLRNGPSYLGQGVRVAIGPGAWDRARRAVAAPVMVVVPGRDPAEFRWPVAGESVLVFETGQADDDALERLAHCLLADGAELVHAIRAGSAGPVWRREG